MEMNQVYRIPGGLFLEGAPVFVKEATMWQAEDKLFAKLSMENKDTARTVSGVTVRFCPIAPNGSVLGDGVVRTFGNLQEAPNGYFAARELTALPEGSCAFGAAVISVGFADGSQWQAESTLAWHVEDSSFNPQAPSK